MKKIVACIFLSLLMAGCNSHTNVNTEQNLNSVADYFKDVELQAETDEQRQEIRIVLSDILNLPAHQLKAKKYPDYESKPDQWDVIKFLTSYFVPSSPKSLSSDHFFEEVEKPEARLAIQGQLQKIEEYFRNNADTTNKNK